MYSFKLWLEKQSNKVWHITDMDSARNIMRSGFIAQDTGYRGHGVSVSVNSDSAAALLRSLQRMNSFKSFEEVEKWWRDRGATKSTGTGTVEQTWEYFQKGLERRPERNHPGHFHLDMMLFHPAVGGDANVPHEEFLYNDIARKLVGKQMVAVEATHDGEIPNRGGIEAELFLQDPSPLQPIKILRTPLEIK